MKDKVFKGKRFGLTTTREHLEHCYPDPLMICGMTDEQVQSAVDFAEEELIKYQGYTEDVIEDFGAMGWTDFLTKHPDCDEIDINFDNEIENGLVRLGCEYFEDVDGDIAANLTSGEKDFYVALAKGIYTDMDEPDEGFGWVAYRLRKIANELGYTDEELTRWANQDDSTKVFGKIYE